MVTTCSSEAQDVPNAHNKENFITETLVTHKSNKLIKIYKKKYKNQ